MRYVTVTALKAVVDGRDVCPGAPVEMHPVRASIAARRGEVSLTRRTYQTRHMEAAKVYTYGDVFVAPDHDGPAFVEIPEPDPPVRRRRRRRKATEDAA